MKRVLMHPAYFEGLSEQERAHRQEMRDEEISAVQRGLVEEQEEQEEDYNSQPKRNELRTSLTDRGSYNRGKYRGFVTGVGVGVILVSLVWLPGRVQSRAVEPVIPAPAVATMSLVADPSATVAKLESEMDLMKKIVSGLVDTVQNLSKVREGVSKNAEIVEIFPYPVRVVGEKTHLRKEASRAALSLLEVSKDTTLMAVAGTDKWLKVSTPQGEDAWVSRSSVVPQKG
jgi:hypothetical protein